MASSPTRSGVAPADLPISVHSRNPGMPLDLRWVRDDPGQPQRRRAPRRHHPHPPHRQDGVAGGVAAPRHHADGPHHAAGRRHAGPGPAALRQGARPVAPGPPRRLGVGDLDIHVAAVCVYHAFVETAVQALGGERHPGGGRVHRLSRGPLAAAAARSPRSRRRSRRARDEIDIVITRAHVLTGDWAALYDEVRAFRAACGAAHLKAILGTGELGTLRDVARASAGRDDGRRRLHQDLHRQGDA